MSYNYSHSVNLPGRIEMFERIASNSYYDIAVDTARNRIYLTIKGFWQTKDLVPHYIEDLSEATGILGPGFTVLANLTRMVPPTAEVSVLHQQAQSLLMKSGLARSAEIVNDPLLMSVVDEYAAVSRATRRVFYDPGFAEVWLDSFEE
jgi:hypothetical protein